MDVADDGAVTFVSRQRAAVRSRAKLDYDAEQAQLDAGTPHPQIALLREVGRRRVAQEIARGGQSAQPCPGGARGRPRRYRAGVPDAPARRGVERAAVTHDGHGRLVDRVGLSVCLDLVEGREVAAPVRAVLPELPGLMTASGRRARGVERGCLDYLEAEMLAGREGVGFRAVVIEQRKDGGIVQLADPAITARCRGSDLPVGEWVDAWLVEAYPQRRSVVFDVSPRRPR